METPSSSDFLRVAGRLTPFFETGTEGVIWSLTLPGVPGYDGLVCLKPGDALFIYKEAGGLHWKGRVDLEYQRRHRPFPLNPQYGQQEINGFWVHGFQKDLSPEDWATPFFEGAPAVAWIPLSTMDPALGQQDQERAVVIEALDMLVHDPRKAWDHVRARAPASADRMQGQWAHAWNNLRQRLGWPPASLEVDCPNEVANAWRWMVSLDRATRIFWQPGLSEAQQWATLAARWPEATESAVANIVTWVGSGWAHDQKPAPPGF